MSDGSECLINKIIKGLDGKKLDDYTGEILFVKDEGDELVMESLRKEDVKVTKMDVVLGFLDQLSLNQLHLIDDCTYIVKCRKGAYEDGTTAVGDSNDTDK